MIVINIIMCLILFSVIVFFIFVGIHEYKSDKVIDAAQKQWYIGYYSKALPQHTTQYDLDRIAVLKDLGSTNRRLH